MNNHGEHPSKKVEAPDAQNRPSAPEDAASSPYARDPGAGRADDDRLVKDATGHAKEGPDATPDPAEVPPTSTHMGAMASGEYATDPATGAGRYMEHTTGTFGLDPVDPPSQDIDAIDPQI